MTERKIPTESIEAGAALFGPFDRNIKYIEKSFGVGCVNRETEAGNAVIVTGEDVAKTDMAAKAIKYLLRAAKTEGEVSLHTAEYVTEMLLCGHEAELGGYDDDCVCVTVKGRPVRPKTAGQKVYASLIKNNTVVFGIGPAGTGKTYLAVAAAVTALRAKEVSRIILTRPAVEAGEKLGYLPGDLQNKIEPYLRPLYDALFEMMGPDSYQKNLEKGVIEIAPLAYMRGRTLDNAFIILDEAQNTTREQMKMILTRLGANSKLVVTGDVTQIDLPRDTGSGLTEASRLLAGIEGIAIHRFTGLDVVRHRLVKEIIAAYERADTEKTVGTEKSDRSTRPQKERRVTDARTDVGGSKDGNE